MDNRHLLAVVAALVVAAPFRSDASEPTVNFGAIEAEVSVTLWHHGMAGRHRSVHKDIFYVSISQLMPISY